MATTAPRRPLSSYVQIPPIREVHPPPWFERLPRRWSTAGILVLLLLAAAVLHSRQLSGQLWFNEAIATGVASHSLGALFSAVRHAGSSPLYYLLLHIWISLFGSSERTTHALSLVFGLLAIPAGCWAGWTLAGRRAGIFAAILFAFSSYLIRFSQETQPYALLFLLGLLTSTGFALAFVHRRRGYLWLFTLGMAALLYTQASAALYAFGALAAYVLVFRNSEERRELLRDGAVGFGVAFVLYLPWLPTTIWQIAHVTAPWHYTPLLGADVPSDLIGGERVDVTLLIAVLVGVAPFIVRERRGTPEAMTVWVLLALPVAAFLLARLSTVATPGWVARYFGSIVPCLLLLGALGAARARIVGVAAVVLCVAFTANASSFTPKYKSDMRDVAGELGPQLHAGDLVLVAQPEQTPLAWFYLPAGVRYVTTLGPVADPSTMNWDHAQARLQAASPAATLNRVVATLRPGQQLLYVRPLTEGVQNWKEPWTQLVRRRAAQWGQILTNDVASGALQPLAWAPHNYRSACCVATSATLYRKAS